MTFTKKEVKEIGTPGAYLYGLKHTDGTYEYSWGGSLSEAASLLGWKPDEIKRGMSLERLPTAEELEKKRLALEALRALNKQKTPKEKKAARRLRRVKARGKRKWKSVGNAA